MHQFLYCPDCSNRLTSVGESEVSRRHCTQCDRIWYRNPTVGVAVIVLDRRGVLLVRRRCGRWCIPCGHVEWHETIEDAARRELREETGLDVELDRVYSVQSNFHDPRHHTVGIWYVGRNPTGDLRAGDDAQDTKWWPINQLPSLAFPTDETVVEQLRNDPALTSAKVASRDGLCANVVREFRKMAAASGLAIHVQQSLRSESAYLRILRDNHWFGLRISSHEPVHASSADFEQLIVPASEDCSKEFGEWARDRIREFLVSGGCVVADPHETEVAIQQRFLSRALGNRRKLPATAEICAVRHQLNERARWIYDIETAGASAEHTSGRRPNRI